MEVLLFCGTPLTFFICVVMRMYDVEKPGIFFFSLMSAMIGFMVNVIVLFAIYSCWHNWMYTLCIILFYLLNALLGYFLIQG